MSMTRKDRMLAAIRGEPTDRIPWAPRLDLWYNANRRAGTLPAKYRKAALTELVDDLDVGYHAVIPDFRDLDSDGNLWGVLDDFKAAGIDGLNPLEPLVGMYAGEVRKGYPDWVLMGGIDASQLLPFATAEEVRATVRRTIDEAGARGRLWLGSSTEIHPAAKLENVLAMWDEIERCGYYASV